MSSILRDRPSVALLIIGLVAAAAGLILSVTGRPLGIPLCAAGLIVELSGPYLHDRKHRQRGEVPHAMWGTNDRNKPSWAKRK